MTLSYTERTLDLVRRLLLEERRDEALDVIASLLPVDKAALFEALEPELQEQLLPHADPGDVADILEEMDDDDAAALAESLDTDALALALDEMGPDKAADLLGDLEPSLRDQALEGMEAAEDVRPLLRHPDDSAGGLMTLGYHAFPENERVGQVFRRIRAQSPRDQEIPFVYAVNQLGQLTGVARLADLIRAHPEQPLSAITDPEVVTVAADEDQETAARLLQRYGLMALPVVDADGRLIGVITADDAMAALDVEASEDIYKTAGIVSVHGREAARSDLLVHGPIWHSWRVRIPFLVISMFGGLVAGVVMSGYKEALEAVIALAFFIPMVMLMGGNAGAQSVEIFIRGHALGQIDVRRFTRHLMRELVVGLGMGAVLGALAAVFSGLWQGILSLSLVVGIAMASVMTMAACLGFLIPFGLVKLGADPAAGAIPFITVSIDIVGVTVYFALAATLMGHLL